MTAAARIQADETAGAAMAQGREYVTFELAGQLFGMPIRDVSEVFEPQGVTPVPLSRPAVKGLLNLRGRIVTALCLRTLLDLPPRAPGEPVMAIGVERGGEPYALLVDQIGDVMRPDPASFETTPSNLTAKWRNTAYGVHRLETELLVILDLAQIVACEGLAA